MEVVMSVEQIRIPHDLLYLKPFDALESLSMSKLARAGTSVLRQIMTSDQAVAVKIQGQGAMVTLSRHQYDEMVALIRQLEEVRSEDGFTQTLSRQFDALTAEMNRPGAMETMDAALFGDPSTLNETYRPGATEADD
jgi:predicted transcriptional regulator